MLRLASYDVVFQEVPDEVTLALNLAGCPNRCPGCHSPHLWEEVGELLDDELLERLLEIYGSSVTCVCFMGGDGAPAEVERLAQVVKRKNVGMKTAWYSGKDVVSEKVSPDSFDYIKLGRYIAELGGLEAKTSNQKFYKIDQRRFNDMTHLFRK